ncbi:MAG: molybdopterin molybdotransferase MoeA [Gammaproteobacteria bacterium]|jgi:molybdopterin molybdotransferase
MLDVARADALIREHIRPLGTTRCPIGQAAGMVLAETVEADRDQPPMDRVMMDGIAISHQAWQDGRRQFRVLGTQAAGRPAASLDDEEACLEVMTGACLPAGCDCVIPVERIGRDGEHATVEPDYQPSPGQFIHPRGSDYRIGSELLCPGILLRGTELAILAASGMESVMVARRPGVSIISTGDELVAGGRPVAEYQVRSSNDTAMAASLARFGLDRIRTLRVADDEVRLLHDIGRELEESDLLVLSGGVSMGKFDFLPGVLDRLGVRQIFHKVRQRPGKPMWFGTTAAGKAVFALPGNPVSALTCLHRYVIPAIRRAMGGGDPPLRRATLAAPYDFEPELCCFLPVKIGYDRDGRVMAEPCPTNTSGDFASLTRTDGFVELPAEMQHFPAGWTAEYYRWL